MLFQFWLTFEHTTSFGVPFSELRG